jgi:hypothetical protein
MHELTKLVQHDEGIMEEAREAKLAHSLTKLLASTTDTALLDTISALLAALSGSTVHGTRLLDFTYPGVGTIKVHECALKEGVGARLWGISHTFNLFIISRKEALRGKRCLELGSGVGSTGKFNVVRQTAHGNTLHSSCSPAVSEAAQCP